jgi:hypothetical protein
MRSTAQTVRTSEQRTMLLHIAETWLRLAVCHVFAVVTVFEVSVLRRTIHGRRCSISARAMLRSCSSSVAPIEAPPFSSSASVAN